MIPLYFFIVAMSVGPQGGLYRYEWGPSEWRMRDFYPVPRCLWITFTPDGRRVYAAGQETQSGRGEIRSLAADKTGRLTPERSLLISSKGACHLAVSPGGRFLYAANYSDGTVTEIALEGAYGPAAREVRTLRWQGRSIDPKRQTGPHPHQCVFSPDGKYLLVCDLGLDEVRSFPFDPEKGVDEKGVIRNAVTPAGSGPRHLVFSPDGNFVYLVTEMGHSLISFSYENGRLRQQKTLPTLPDGWTLPDTTAACRLSPDGRFIAVTNRGHDSVTLFELDGRGEVRRRFTTATGRQPRDGNFLPGGQFYATANEKADSVTIFRYDAAKGELIPANHVWHHPNPLQIEWPKPISSTVRR